MKTKKRQGRKPVGVPVAGQKDRTCLRCNKQFNSIGPGNRICPWCENQPVKISRAEEVYADPFAAECC